MHTKSSTAAFASSLALVLDEARNIKELHRSAHAGLIQFAIDVSLVAHGVRTGYLVDAVFPPSPGQVFATLLIALRGKSSVFKHVVWWHHAPTSQSFLVHVPLLQEKFTAMLGRNAECMFIKLDECFSVAKEPPNSLRKAFREMELLMSEFPDAPALSLSDALTEEILIPLAAVTIDYPVAYFPAYSAQTSFLEGQKLDIYTVSFRETTSSGSTLGVGKDRLLLKFSCPQVLANNHPEVSPPTLREKLNAKFTSRLGLLGMHTLVTHHTETLDRVAL